MVSNLSNLSKLSNLPLSKKSAGDFSVEFSRQNFIFVLTEDSDEVFESKFFKFFFPEDSFFGGKVEQAHPEVVEAHPGALHAYRSPYISPCGRGGLPPSLACYCSPRSLEYSPWGLACSP